MFVVCSQHVDRAIEQFVDEYEDAPDLYKLEDVRFTAWEAPAKCQFCEEHAMYLIV